MKEILNLGDPELELIDPTPNVHSMFLHFDKMFFRAKLLEQCTVRWSKRMYSCAGICTWSRRGGCDIALSEPLLKLRSRKDLVETLLHEMIHAYLFVTRQDQNRDGHGPNFLKHMDRINKAAGLNISVYHEFNDEVELYMTHWWRCSGPCQLRKPHFGIVRRSNNRAPGPSEYWWHSHLKNCGGTFIKIREPDKIVKTNKKSEVAKPSPDIRKYINIDNKDDSNKNVIQIDNNPYVLPLPASKDSNNVKVNLKEGIKSINNSTLVISKKTVIFSPKVPKSKSVVNGKELIIHKGKSNKDEHKKISSTDVLETVKKVWANKYVVPNNNKHILQDAGLNSASNLNKNKTNFHTESPSRQIKKINDYFENKKSSSISDLETVKNVWASKYEVSNNNKHISQDAGLKSASNLNIHKTDFHTESPSRKIKNTDCSQTAAILMLKELYGEELNISEIKGNEKLKAIPKENKMVLCPVCNSKIDTDKINNHLDECLNKDLVEELSNNTLIGKEKPKEENHTSSDIKSAAPIKTVDLSTNVNRKRSRTSCDDFRKVEDTVDLTANVFVNDFIRKKPRTSCGDFRNTEDIQQIQDNKNKENKTRKSDEFKEPNTSYITQVQSNITPEHTSANPLIKIDGSIVDCNKPNSQFEISCPCCGDKLYTSVNEHLDECISFFDNNDTIPEEGSSPSRINDTIVIDDDDDEFDESKIFNETGTKFPCPCCLKMIEEINMNSHLDKCLSN